MAARRAVGGEGSDMITAATGVKVLVAIRMASSTQR
jgi:hypothetical protein